MRPSSYRLVGWIMVGLLAATPLLAASPNQTQKNLEKTLKEMEAAKKQSEDLRKKAQRAKEDLEPLQRAMVAQSRDLQTIERTLSKLEREAATAQAKVDQKEKELAHRKKEIAASLDAMVRLRQTPPEALVARPGKLTDTISAAQLLQHLSEQLQQKAALLQQELYALSEAQEELKKSKEKVESKRNTMLAKQDTLEGQLKERQKLYELTNQELSKVKKQVSSLGKRSRSLQDLLERLEEANNKPQFKRSGTAQMADLTRVRKEAFLLPVTGPIIKKYGEKGSRGVKIKARPSANVIAPYEGEVVFTGPFLDYGNMVILRHAGDYHTLLAGLSRIDCAPGQTLKRGEPLGKIGKSLRDAQLYLEFRKHSKPVNPNGWFKGL